MRVAYVEERDAYEVELGESGRLEGVGVRVVQACGGSGQRVRVRIGSGSGLGVWVGQAWLGSGPQGKSRGRVRIRGRVSAAACPSTSRYRQGDYYTHSPENGCMSIV